MVRPGRWDRQCGMRRHRADDVSTLMRTMDTFQGARVTVMGLGRFGGGIGVTRWLAAQGARVLVTDQAGPSKLGESIAAIADLIDVGLVSLRLAVHREADFINTDLVIANPAVPKPWDNIFLRAALEAGVSITTEIRLVVERLDRSRVVGITGSAGKSTTSAMIHHTLRGLGHRAHLGGNIGGSLLASLPSPSGFGAGGEGDSIVNRQSSIINPDDFIVLELSSAQLYWLGKDVGISSAPGWSPHVAVITNITPNHFDWHGSFEHYRESKLNIARQRCPGDHLIDGREEWSHALQNVTMSLRTPGQHNVTNARLACLAVNAMTGDSIEDCAAALADFVGLPHRLQLVADIEGLRFYNDSKSTTPQATVLAVESFDDPARIHLIVGGSDKGSDLLPISSLAPRLAGLYAIGLTGRTIMAGIASPSDGGGRLPFARFCETLDRAVECARPRMKPGDILLLSPGCASFDQFTNFEARGEAFSQLVKDWRPTAQAAL